MKRLTLASTAVLAALAFVPNGAEARGFGGFHGGFRGGYGGFRGAGFRGGYGRFGYGYGRGYGGLGLGLGVLTGAAVGYGLAGGYSGYPYGYGYSPYYAPATMGDTVTTDGPTATDIMGIERPTPYRHPPSPGRPGRGI